MRTMITVVQCRNVPGEWDGWNVYRGTRRIGSFARRVTAFRFATNMVRNAAAR